MKNVCEMVQELPQLKEPCQLELEFDNIEIITKKEYNG